MYSHISSLVQAEDGHKKSIHLLHSCPVTWRGNKMHSAGNSWLLSFGNYHQRQRSHSARSAFALAQAKALLFVELNTGFRLLFLKLFFPLHTFLAAFRTVLDGWLCALQQARSFVTFCELRHFLFSSQVPTADAQWLPLSVFLHQWVISLSTFCLHRVQVLTASPGYWARNQSDLLNQDYIKVFPFCWFFQRFPISSLFIFFNFLLL